MTYQISSDTTLRALCAELGDDDGVDPHEFTRRDRGRAHGRRHAVSPSKRPHGATPRGPDKPPERKVAQLCRQVALTLDEVFAECGDPVLQNLRVADVTPMSDGARLLVAVAPLVSQIESRSRPQAILSRLDRASRHLRYEVASAITRKRAPLLHYCLANLNDENH